MPAVDGALEVSQIGRQPSIHDGIDDQPALAKPERQRLLLAPIACKAFNAHLHNRNIIALPATACMAAGPKESLVDRGQAADLITLSLDEPPDEFRNFQLNAADFSFAGRGSVTQSASLPVPRDALGVRRQVGRHAHRSEWRAEAHWHDG